MRGAQGPQRSMSRLSLTHSSATAFDSASQSKCREGGTVRPKRTNIHHTADKYLRNKGCKLAFEFTFLLQMCCLESKLDSSLDSHFSSLRGPFSHEAGRSCMRRDLCKLHRVAAGV